jgi:hypothetical protein
MHPFHVVLAVFGLAALVALGLLIRWERRRFLRMGKSGAWLAAPAATGAHRRLPARTRP